MNIVKIGNRYVNLDQVADYWVVEDGIKLFSPTGEIIVKFTGDDQELLCWWLDNVAADIQAVRAVDRKHGARHVAAADASAESYNTLLKS